MWEGKAPEVTRTRIMPGTVAEVASGVAPRRSARVGALYRVGRGAGARAHRAHALEQVRIRLRPQLVQLRGARTRRRASPAGRCEQLVVRLCAHVVLAFVTYDTTLLRERCLRPR